MTTGKHSDQQEFMEQGRSYYPFLDGFRAFAILWVIWHHLEYSFHVSGFFPEFLAPALQRGAFIGTLGVDLFFVISGFLISGLLLGDMEGRVRIKRFYIRRSFKILPQYILTVLVGTWLVYQYAFEAPGPLSLASYWGLFQNYVPPVKTLAHLWSISVEEHFYFVYPLLIWAVCRAVSGAEARRRALFMIALAVIVLVFWVRRQTFIAYPYNELSLFQMTHLRIDALLVGCLIKLSEPALLRLGAFRPQLISGMCFLLGLFFYVLLFYKFDPCRSTTYVYGYLASGLMLVSGLLGWKPLLALTQNVVMRWIGKSSYATYLWHYPVFLLAHQWIPSQANVIFIVGVTTACLLAGDLSTRTVERYFLNLRQRVAP